MNDDGDKIPVRFLSLPLLCADRLFRSVPANYARTASLLYYAHALYKAVRSSLL
jgi:hypothetical protein